MFILGSEEVSDLTTNIPRPSRPSTGSSVRRTVPQCPQQSNNWSEVDAVPNINVFIGQGQIQPGTNLQEGCTVSDIFTYFIDNDIFNIIKQQTNLYAAQRIRKLRSKEALSPTCRMAEWKTVTLLEVKKFFAIIVHMSFSTRPQIQDHWSSDPVSSCNFCPNVMGRNRFLLILSNLHLNDNSCQPKKNEPAYDPLYKLRPLIDRVAVRFQQTYRPGENITVDEGMCKFRGRLVFKQYMPQKPSKYGVKLYMLSESATGYIWNFQIYCGQSNVVTQIVENLLGDLANEGRTLYTDRYYTSPALATALEGKNTGLVGTVMPNRKGLPKELKNPKLKKGEQAFRRSGNMLAVTWKDKKDVHMLSTRHTASMVTYSNKQGKELTKPACVVGYNKNKYGVDLSDQRMSYGAFDHKSVKWWRKVMFHVVLMCIANCNILYNKINRKKLTMTQFMKLLSAELVVQELDIPPSTSGRQLSRLQAGKHFLEKIPVPEGKNRLQKRCKVCSVVGKKQSGRATRKDTSYQCSECKIAMCKEPCFKNFHTKKNFST